jgi:HAD superfamily hydrolase (TIGR01509 family)
MPTAPVPARLGATSVSPARGPFRALSLDLWFTAYFYGADDEARWEQARVDSLRECLEPRDGRGLDDAAIAEAFHGVYARLEPASSFRTWTDPATVVEAVAEALGARLRRPLDVAAGALSAAGLEERPPCLNPEAVELVRTLRRRGVPTVVVTNSARRAATWADFFRRHAGPEVEDVVSSCDVGRGKPDPTIFREAADRLDLPAAKILHVGDRWELDVAGALRAGFGAALYRGLWDRYPEGTHLPCVPSPRELERALVVDRLDELLRPDLWEAPACPREGSGRSD